VADFWDSAFSYGLDARPKLSVLHDANRNTDWLKLEDFLDGSRKAPHNYIAFVSSDDDIDTRKDHVALVQKRGDVIAAKPPNPEHLFLWLSMEFPSLSASVINHTIDRLAGEPSACYNTALKLAVFGTPSAQLVDTLCHQRIDADFTDTLIRGDKERAMQAGQGLEAGQVLGLLDARLEQMRELNRAVRTGTDPDVPKFVQLQFERCAGTYTRDKVAHCRQLLAVVEHASREGTAVGAVEALVRLW